MNRCSLCLLSILLILSASAIPKNIELIEDTPQTTRFRIEIDDPTQIDIGGGYTLFLLDGYGYRGKENGPQLLGKSFIVAVPPDSKPELEIESVEWSEWANLVPAPQSISTNIEWNPGFGDSELYSQIYGGSVEISGKSVIRGVTVANIEILPIEYVPEKGVRFMRKIEIKITHNGNKPSQCSDRLYHPTFAKIFEAMLVNPESAIPRERVFEITEWDPADGAELLVICAPTFTDELEPWIDWKLLMGLPTRVVTTDTTGTSTTNIKNYIQNAYDTWSLPPAYVLFVGDVENVTTYTDWDSDNCIGDNKYGCVDGGDYYPDILPGRMSCDASDQVELLVQKHLNYEKTPDMSDDWWARAVGVINEDGPPYGPVDSSYTAAVEYAIDQCDAAGYTSTEIFRNSSGDDSGDVSPYISAGCGFVIYRGQAYPDWYSPFQNLHSLNTGAKCPVTVSITCVTGGFHTWSDQNLCEVSTRAGTATNPQGSVSWIGQAVVSSYSLERSSLSKHVFEGFFPAELNQLAAAHNYGKNEMVSEFGATSGAEREFLTSILIGSPEMLAWTAPIQYPVVTHPPAVSEGPVDIDIDVAAGGDPVENARVAIHQGSDFSYALTNSTGNSTVSIDVDPANPLILVVTGPNIYPYQDTIDVSTIGVGVFCAPVEFQDSVGDGDGLINPGETIRFTPIIFNMGTEAAGGLVATARCDAGLTWIDSTTSFPYIAPGDTVEGDELVFLVPEDSPTSGNITFYLYISGHPDGPWVRNVVPEPGIHRFSAIFESMTIHDDPPYGNGNGEIEAGEIVDLCITLNNNTQADAWNALGILQDGPSLAVLQPMASKDSWNRGTPATLEPCFTVSISPDVIPSEDISTIMALDAECSIYDFIDTINIPLQVYGSISNLPTGPDSYGYYMIDNTDSITGIQPNYLWNDISSIGDELLPISDADDEIQSVTLPFTMVYYGQSFNTITCASNGYIAPGNDDWDGPGSGQPQEFPHSGGPEGIIAPAWADLAPHRTGGGEIYAYYDTGNNQAVIQWDDVEFYYAGGNITCQVRICNPTVWPTPTGDSEIFIHYNSFTGLGVMGTGIESPDETDGLQYFRDGVYDINAAEIQAERSIRITTIEPIYTGSPWLFYFDELAIDDSAGNNNGIIEPSETVGIRMRIKNGGSATASNVNGIVADEPPFITSDGPAVLFGNIPVDGTAFNSSNSMKLVIDGSCPSDTIIEVPINLTATGYNTTTKIWLHIGDAVDIDEEKKLPRGLNLGIAYPNPFNSVVSFNLSVGVDITGTIDISAFDITGRQVSTIHNGTLFPGKHTFRFTPDNLSSGIYFIRVKSPERILRQKILLVK